MSEPGPFESGRYDPNAPTAAQSSPSLDKGQPQYQSYDQAPQYPSQQYDQAPQYQPQQYQAPPPPKSNAGWAVAAVIFFWPVAFSAFTHALNVYPKWAMGDYQGAQYASDRAKQLGRIAMWIFIVFIVIVFALYALLIFAAVNSLNGVS